VGSLRGPAPGPSVATGRRDPPGDRDGVGPRWLRMTLIPATLMLLCPPTAILVWYTHRALGGSIAALGQLVAREGLGGTVSRVFTPVFFGSPTAWAVIGIFAASQLALLRLLPGPPFHGPVTTTGHVPAYTANGPAALAVTLALFGGASFGLEIFPAPSSPITSAPSSARSTSSAWCSACCSISRAATARPPATRASPATPSSTSTGAPTPQRPERQVMVPAGECQYTPGTKRYGTRRQYVSQSAPYFSRQSRSSRRSRWTSSAVSDTG
jgi:hypothetical protein